MVQGLCTPKAKSRRYNAILNSKTLTDLFSEFVATITHYSAQTLHRYLWKYLSHLNKSLVWEGSFNAFCQNPPKVFGKLKKNILKPAGRLLALNLAWA